MPSSLCFYCGQSAVETVNVPAGGWGAGFAKVPSFEVPACAAHAAGPAEEGALVKLLIETGNRKAPRPAAEVQPALRAWLERLARAVYAQVFEKPWGRPVVVVCPRLGVADEARDLADELQDELKEPIMELFPEAGPHTRLDYHFFEADTDLDEDNVLWLRLPGGLVAYAWPGEL